MKFCEALAFRNQHLSHGALTLKFQQLWKGELSKYLLCAPSHPCSPSSIRR